MMIAHAFSKLNERSADKELVENNAALVNRFYTAVRGDQPVFVEILSGDYGGSIALVGMAYPTRPCSERVASMVPKDPYRRVENPPVYEVEPYPHELLKLTWTGRRNKIQLHTSNVSWLEDYDGETVFKLIDKKAVASKLLEKPQVDIRGSALSIGDEVLYINARYGSGACLCDGTITGFKAENATTKYAKTAVLVRNKQNPDEESKIFHSETMILKVS